MKILYSVPILLLLLCALTLVQAQRESQSGPQPRVNQTSNAKSKREIVQDEQLGRLLSRVGISVDASRAANDQRQAYREMKIRWTGQTGAQAEGANAPADVEGTKAVALSTSILEEKTLPGTLPKHRSLELSQTQVLIAAVDEKDQLRWWSLMPDPRVVRAETQTPAGDLRSEEHYLSDLTLVVSFPEDPGIVNLRFYHPSWNGTDFDLQLLAVAPVR